MSHFGVLSYKGTGHLNPLIALACQLVSLGHKVTFFQSQELEPRVLQQGLSFCAININARSEAGPNRAGYNKKSVSRLTRIHEGVDRIADDMESFLRTLPDAIRAAGVDVLLVSEISLSGPTIAEMLHIPYFIISTSIPHNFGWKAPRSISHSGSLLDRLEKSVLEVSVLRMWGPVRYRLNKYRRQVGLSPIDVQRKTYPELAHITQWPQCLDLPQSNLPGTFFYAGPFCGDRSKNGMEFPWECLDGRPLVYASLGTTRKNDPDLFRRIAEACSTLNVQLLIALGGRRDPADFACLPGNPVVVSNAPQLELLKRASLVITHAGPNTVLESLVHGRPMVALPMRLDQPAVSVRLIRAGVGVVLSDEHRSVLEIRSAIEKVLNDPSFRLSAEYMQAQIRSIGGLEYAASIIDALMAKHSEKTH